MAFTKVQSGITDENMFFFVMGALTYKHPGVGVIPEYTEEWHSDPLSISVFCNCERSQVVDFSKPLITPIRCEREHFILIWQKNEHRIRVYLGKCNVCQQFILLHGVVSLREPVVKHYPPKVLSG